MVKWIILVAGLNCFGTLIISVAKLNYSSGLIESHQCWNESYKMNSELKCGYQSITWLFLYDIKQIISSNRWRKSNCNSVAGCSLLDARDAACGVSDVDLKRNRQVRGKRNQNNSKGFKGKAAIGQNVIFLPQWRLLYFPRPPLIYLWPTFRILA